MSVATRIGGFVLGLAVVFALATFAGAKLDPSVAESTNGHEKASEEMNAPATALSTTPPGLAVAEAGYRLVPEASELSGDASATIGFRIVDGAGATVREFDLEHGRRMHLILIRRDFANFQHLHPRQLDDGSWRVEGDLSEAGVYRVFADFAIAGGSLTLATDVFVAGDFAPQPLAAPTRTDSLPGGYEVTLESPHPTGGATTPVGFRITRNGRPHEAIEPYLGADGHLVALREHDQAFLHTHPEGEPGGHGPIEFAVEYPSAGRYRLFLQFKDGGAVHTAAFTQVAAAGAEAAHSEEADDAGH